MTYSDWLPFILLPVISAFIGWLTNKLALFMLFRPRGEKNLLVARVQGLIPRHQPEMAKAIAETVSTHFVNKEAIERELSQPAVREAVVDGLAGYTRGYLSDFIASLPGPVRKLLPKRFEEKVNSRLRKEVEKHLPRLMETVTPAVASNIDFRGRIEKEIAAYPHERLEKMIHDIAGKELRAIEVWGAVLGFIIGVAQAAMVFALR